MPEEEAPAGAADEQDAPEGEGGTDEDQGEIPSEAYPDDYAEPPAEETYDAPYDEPDPAASGWIPLEDDAATSAPVTQATAPAASPAPPAVFPTAGFVLGLLAFAAVAYARIDLLAASIDLDALSRSDIRGIARELGVLLFAGTLLIAGATADRLGGGAKAALFITGALVLLGVPQNLL